MSSNPFIIGIAGASGSGKSTLATHIKKKYSEKVEVIHFDDYQKEEKEVPLLENMRNWDHPDAIDFEKLLNDIKKLKNKEEVKILTKDRLINPNYEEVGRKENILQAKPILILEGYLALHSDKIRELLDYTIFLDIPIEESMKRRDKLVEGDEYNSKILKPMHLKYVKPSQKYAKLQIDALKNNSEKVSQLVEQKLRELKILN
jgi:uridine kinase